MCRSKSAALPMGNIHNGLIRGLGINGPSSADRRRCDLRPFRNLGHLSEREGKSAEVAAFWLPLVVPGQAWLIL